MAKIDILAIDESAAFGNELKAMLANSEPIGAIRTATSLEEGIDILKTYAPHIILLDANISGKENQSPLLHIFAVRMVPTIVMAEGTVQQTAKTVQAMTNGAVDFIKFSNKDNASIKQLKDQLINKIINATNSKPVRAEKCTSIDSEISELTQPKSVFRDSKREKSIVMIGTSTGGPRALHKLLKSMPADFPAPIFIVQHMPAGFTKSLAERLNNDCKLKVKEAEDGEIASKGIVYVAPGDYHMRVTKTNGKLKIKLKQDEECLGHRPSVNVLFGSASKLDDVHKVAIVLTGMGKDGADGVKMIKKSEQSAFIIAESKKTAVIHGMPNAAIQTNCITKILDLDEIAGTLIEYMNKQGE